LRESATIHGAKHLHDILRRLDPLSAKKIAAADVQKVIRAVEVCLLAKRPLSELHREGRAPLEGWRAIEIGLAPEREALYERVHARADAMLERGWESEVRRLVESGLPEDAKPFEFIGYRELRAVLRKEMTLQDAKTAIQQATRRYAKRQTTWFRRESGVRWLKGFGDEAEVQAEALAIARSAVISRVPGAGGMDV